MKNLLNNVKAVSTKLMNVTSVTINALKAQPKEVIQHAEQMLFIDHRQFSKNAFEQLAPTILFGSATYIFGRFMAPKIFKVKNMDKHISNQNVYAGVYGFGVGCLLVSRVIEVHDVKQALRNKEIIKTKHLPPTCRWQRKLNQQGMVRHPFLFFYFFFYFKRKINTYYHYE